MYIYYPSCNFSAASPATAKKVKAYFEKQMPGCRLLPRRQKREFPWGYRALHLSGMPRNARRQSENAVDVGISRCLKRFQLSEPKRSKILCAGLLARPQSPGDPRSRAQPFKEKHAEAIEIEHNREKSIFCGNLHYETDDPRLKNYPNTPLYKLPEDLQTSLMQHYAAQFDPQIPVLCYCNRCYECLRMGGAAAVHLLDIAFSEM